MANNEKSLFELIKSSEDREIYQRSVKEQGRSKKQIEKIVSQLPTATVHLIAEEKYERLKKIEEALLALEGISNHNKRTLKSIIFDFFEI